MSRTAAAYLNVPLAQVDNAAQYQTVFERNVAAALTAGLRQTDPTPEIITLADLLKSAAADVVATLPDAKAHNAAKRDFKSIAADLRKALFARGNQSKRSEIDALGMH